MEIAALGSKTKKRVVLAPGDQEPKKPKPLKPGFRIKVVGNEMRRIDLNAARAKRKVVKALRAAKGPIEDDRVAQVWGRADRREAGLKRERQAMQEIRGPRKEAAKDVAERERIGKESATPERAARAGVDLDVSPLGYQRLSDAPLERLKARGVVTQIQYDAGDNYREDHYRAGMQPSGVIDPLAPRVGGGAGGSAGFMPSTHQQAAARQRLRAADACLGEELAPVAEEVLIRAEAGSDLAQIGRKLFGRAQAGEARASLIEVFKVALDKLSRHYGYDRRTRMRAQRFEKNA